MGWLNIDDMGMDLHIGGLAFYTVNADEEGPGCFSLNIPLGIFGALIVGWEPGLGWDFYRLSPGEALVLRLSTQCLDDIPDPTDEELMALEAELSAGDHPM